MISMVPPIKCHHLNRSNNNVSIDGTDYQAQSSTDIVFTIPTLIPPMSRIESVGGIQ